MREDMAKVLVERPRLRGCALNKPKSYWRELYGIATEDQPRSIRRSESLQCRRIGGIWHLVELQPLPADLSRCQKRDVVLNRRVAEMDELLACQTYGARVYAVSIRRLSKRELSQYP